MSERLPQGKGILGASQQFPVGVGLLCQALARPFGLAGKQDRPGEQLVVEVRAQRGMEKDEAVS